MLIAYATTVTGVVAGMMSFSLIWQFTRIEALPALFLSLMIAIFAGGTFGVTAELIAESKQILPEPDSQSRWVTCENGLQVMIQSSRRKVAS